MKRNLNQLITALLMSFVCIVPSIAQPAALTAEQLAERADIVAVGTVGVSQSGWNSNRTRIVTSVTINVDQYLKGESQSSAITLEIPGGEVGSVGEVYSHAARFKYGEEVVVFANRRADGKLLVTAGDQGKLDVRLDTRSGRKIVAENELLEVFVTRVAHAVRTQRTQNTR